MSISNFKTNYNKKHAWQYDIRLKNFEADLAQSNLSREELLNLNIKDFKFSFIDSKHIFKCHEIKSFIERHEWLGKMPHRPTHRFIATYKGILAGAVIMATPNTFSHLLGKENMHLEKLIARGACISWSPKNLASALLMYSINWMAQNTEYRYFTAYADPEAKELVTIYQACNFIYLGQNSGARNEYFNPQNPLKGWFSNRFFRKTSSYKHYAQELEIKWEENWSYRDQIFWENIPASIATQLKTKSNHEQSNCTKRELPKKHKYVYFQGKTKKETKKLLKAFHSLNPDSQCLAYPKDRGSLIPPRKTKIQTVLTKIEHQGRPHGHKKFLTVTEAAQMFNISSWMIYNLIKTDPTIPVYNVGLKKKYAFETDSLINWFSSRTNNLKQIAQNIPTAQELLKGVTC